jgi:hypothetical protein
MTNPMRHKRVSGLTGVPILLHFATTLTGQPTPAIGTALWITFGLPVGGALAGIVLYLLGGARPVAPSLTRFLGGGEPGWDSPPLLAAIRGTRRANAEQPIITVEGTQS